ncbi:MAG: hypothetical protein ACK4L4_07680 [Gemmobacter sp.]
MSEYCTLTGIFEDPAGVAFGGAVLTFKVHPDALRVTGSRINAPVPPAPITTGSDGAVTLVLAPGRYVGTATRGAQSFRFELGVPDLPTAPLKDYVGRVDVPVLTSAQKARDEAVAAAVATAADRAQTGLDRAATGDDAAATGADRVQTGLDRVATGEDRLATGAHAQATAADRVQTGLDASATATDRAAIETGLIVYVTDDAVSVTVSVGIGVVVSEGTSPYPNVTFSLEVA